MSGAPPRRPARRGTSTANLFVVLDLHRPWRHVKITGHRAAAGFAECMRDIHYPKAERIRVVLDNLSTHAPSALYQTFPADEARRILRRPEFHYVPKHASWLNMVEDEIRVLKGQCLARRTARHSRRRSPAGSRRATPLARASSGSSTPNALAARWLVATRCPRWRPRRDTMAV